MVNDLIARALAVQATKNDMTIAEKQQLANCERDRHSHLNKEALDKIDENNNVGTYSGVPTYDGVNLVTESILNNAVSKIETEISALHPIDTLVNLALDTTYASLSVRSDWQNVPVYSLSDSNIIVTLASDNTIGAFAESELCLLYLIDYDTGMPLPVLRVCVNGALYTCYPAVYHYVTKDYAAGWYDENDDACNAPTLADMTFDSLTVGEDSPITDFTSLSGEALSALQTLSRMVNVSTAAMGTLGMVEDSVYQLNHTPVAGRTYYFATNRDLELTLPTISWTHDDLQLAIYLKCTDDIDVTFPTGTRFIGGTPNTKIGTHKLIFLCPKDENTWAVGGLDVEGA